MVQLGCVLVPTGLVFPVEIELSATVAEMKEKIKEPNPETIRCDASCLHLSIANRDKHSQATQALADGIQSRMEEGTDTLVPVQGDIHIVVEIPESPPHAPLVKRKFYSLCCN